jgi:hypothetical protein
MNMNEENYIVRPPRDIDNLTSYGEISNYNSNIQEQSKYKMSNEELAKIIFSKQSVNPSLERFPSPKRYSFDNDREFVVLNSVSHSNIIPFSNPIVNPKPKAKVISEARFRQMKNWLYTTCFLASFDNVIVGVHKCENMSSIDYVKQASKDVYNELVRNNKMNGQKYLYMLNILRNKVILVVVIPRDLYINRAYGIEDLQFNKKDFDTCEYSNVRISYHKSTKSIQDYDFSENPISSKVMSKTVISDNKQVMYTLFDYIRKHPIDQTLYEMTYIWNVPRRKVFDVWEVMDGIDKK